MGTPDFAVSSLEAIHNSSHKLMAVVTVPDKPAGRGKKRKESPVKKFATENNIAVFQPDNLKNEAFIADLEAFQADVFVVVAFRMLPKVVWQIPKRGTFNAHASLLPNYRGAAPINWALINGEKVTGVTTFLIDEKIDTGALLLKDQLLIDSADNFGSLHDKLAAMSATLCLKTIDALEKNVEAKPQEVHGKEKEAPKLGLHNTVIDWRKDLNEIVNQIRGLNPFPSAWTTLSSAEEPMRIKIFEAQAEFAPTSLAPGTLITTKSTIKVAHREGFLELLELQLPNKRRMKVKDLLNGFQFPDEAVLK